MKKQSKKDTRRHMANTDRIRSMSDEKLAEWLKAESEE